MTPAQDPTTDDDPDNDDFEPCAVLHETPAQTVERGGSITFRLTAPCGDDGSPTDAGSEDESSREGGTTDPDGDGPATDPSEDGGASSQDEEPSDEEEPGGEQSGDEQPDKTDADEPAQPRSASEG